MHRSESEQVDDTEKRPGDIESQIAVDQRQTSVDAVEQPELNEKA